MTHEIKTLAVVGAGTMGHGIAQLIACAGLTVRLTDVDQAVLDQAVQQATASVEKLVAKGQLEGQALENLKQYLSTTTDLAAAVAGTDLVIEAVPEDMALKQAVFRQLDQHCLPQTILASNTSALSIDELAGVVSNRQRVLGLHFFNPVALMPLVEIIAGLTTPPELLDAVMDFAEGLGKTPVVAKNVPGFIVNRVARNFYGEALRMLEENVASVEVLDAIMRETAGFKMGPFELMDLIGIDVNYAVTQSVYEASFHEGRFKPHPLQRTMVENGLLGRKTGAGFYHYDG